MIPGIVLAAGQSSRMGRPKALLPINQSRETFLAHVTRTLLDGGVEEVVVVVGADADAILEAVGKERSGAGQAGSPTRQPRWGAHRGPASEATIDSGVQGSPRVRSDTPRVRFVYNPDYEKGQLSSLLVALRAIDRPGVSAAMVTLIDVPLISAATVQTLIRAHREHDRLIVRPVSNGRHGHPVIFHRALFDELRRADPAQGAKSVVHAHAADVLEIRVEDEGAFIDIDTPEDYERYIAGGRT